jgi:hypothetical protein
MKPQFMRQVFLFAILFLFASLLLDALIVLLSHIPPKAINLDGLLLALGSVERFFAWPRVLLRHLWPGENTPAWLNQVAYILNYFFWGLLLAGLQRFWIAARK